jgi:hypothetical protein
VTPQERGYTGCLDEDDDDVLLYALWDLLLPALRKDAERRNVSPGLRFTILKRDSFRCRYCGRSPDTHPSLVLHVDHKVSLFSGGSNDESNLVTACSECNLGKGYRSVWT